MKLKLIIKKMHNKASKFFLEEHLNYEIGMFINSLFEHINLKNMSIHNKDTLKNFRLEVTAVHGRNLIEFFYIDERKKGDAKAYDYFNKSSDWTSKRGKINKLISKFKKKAETEVLHLGYGRKFLLETDRSGWQYKTVFNEIKNTIIIFLENIDEKYKGNNMNNLLDFFKNTDFKFT